MENLSKNEEGYTLPGTLIKSFTPKEIKVIKKFDPFQDPPDLELAYEHGQAKKVYQQTKEDKFKTANQKACPCCGLAIGGQLLPLNTNLKELYYLGSGYIIYFIFIKYSVGLIALLFAFSGLFNLLTNYYGDDCPSHSEDGVDESCKHSFILSFALNNKRDDIRLLSVLLLVNFASVIAIMVFFHFIRYQFRKTQIEVDKETITPSDYTVELKGVDPTMSDKEIIQWLKKFENKNKPLNIVKINRTYKIDEYIRLMRQKENLIKNQTKYADDQNRLAFIQLKIDGIEASFEAFKRKKLKPTSVVFVVFQTSAEAEYVEDRFHKGFLRKRFERLLSKFMHTYDQLAGKTITVRRAPEPTDIIWENLSSTRAEQYKKKIFVDIYTLILVAIGFGFVILINWVQELIKHNVENEPIIRLLSFLSSILIFLWDLLMTYLTKKLTNTEKNPTLTSYYTGASGRLSIIQLINSGFTTLFAKIIVADNFSISMSTGLRDRLRIINIYEKGGLIENMYFVFIIYAILPPILTILDPLDIFKSWRQSRVKNRSLTLKMVQKQAHQFFEGPEIDMSDKYAFLIRTILLTSFYAPAMPFALIYSALGLIFTYWTDKYILLRRIALPKSLNNELGNAMIEYLEWMAFMFAIGSFLFIYILQDSAHNDVFEAIPNGLVWITLGFSLFHIYFPMGWLNKRLFCIKTNRNETQTYSQARFQFTTDYDIENPMTRKKALSDFMFEVKGMIEMGAYNKQYMSTKEGAFTKLTMEDIIRLLSPESNDDHQDFLFLERYAHEIGENTILDRKRTITKLRMDLIRVLSKFDAFRKHSKKTMVQKFITNAKFSIRLRDYSDLLSTEGNYNKRDSFSKTGKNKEMILISSFDVENRDGSPKPEKLNVRFTTFELSRFAEDRMYLAFDDTGEDNSYNFQLRQEFAQRTFEIKNRKL